MPDGSQTAALRAHAAEKRLELPEEWVFEDEGHSGATLVRPALERLRDLVAQVGVDVVPVGSSEARVNKAVERSGWGRIPILCSRTSI
ncbi:recombinase family protein [Streptomyces sp. 110]|uniref:Recombinase family protein n=1 Tax=Streptomyces endocoffeicus TaxID=2898945 RepID=A0ABS1Q7C3_9ACTN|nr:recombinase family protein [Streptomyces endocoffeicus]MBL1120052.1 recombinase family protein [Streptomyces endocoffeicus]